MDWTIFGWAGIQLEIPTAWELSGLSGDQKTGYLRLDDGEMPRLELKWAHTRRKKPDLHATLDEYFKLIRKTYKRKGTELSFRRNVNLIKEEGFFEGRNLLGFSWKGDIRANGLIFHVGKRITIVQVMGRLKENWRPTVLRIFQSIVDCSEAPQTLWSAYGLKLGVPKEYKLERQKLLSGYLLFVFVAKPVRFKSALRLAKLVRDRVQKKTGDLTDYTDYDQDSTDYTDYHDKDDLSYLGNQINHINHWSSFLSGKSDKSVVDFTSRDVGRLSVERYGPAEMMLDDYKDTPNPLETWFRAKYAKAIRGYGFEVTSHTDADDEHLILVGEQTRFYDGVPFSPVLILDKLSKRTAFVFHLWRCNHSNRIYVIQSIGSKDGGPTVQKVVESIKCH